MSINSIRTAINALTSEDMSGLERFSAIMLSISMLTPQIIHGLGNLSKLLSTSLGQDFVGAIGMWTPAVKSAQASLDAFNASMLAAGAASGTATSGATALTAINSLLGTSYEHITDEAAAAAIAENMSNGASLETAVSAAVASGALTQEAGAHIVAAHAAQ